AALTLLVAAFALLIALLALTTSGSAFQIVTHRLQASQLALGIRGALLLLIALPHGFLRLLKLVTHIVDRASHRRLPLDNLPAHATADVLGRVLHAALHVVLLCLADRFSNTGRRIRLRVRHLPRGLLHVLF